MDNSHNVLIVGFGSIGKRHFDNLRSLGVISLGIVSNSLQTPPDRETKLYRNIDEAYSDARYETVIVSSETSRHSVDVKELLKYPIQKLYIEKPVSVSSEEFRPILDSLEARRIYAVVGYDLRCDPGLRKVKELITDGTVGHIISFHAEVGQYLPDWRPHADYRETMSAKQSRGGGVMLDLVHEFDYANWLFGPFREIVGKHGHRSHLQIETEDVSVNILESVDGILGLIHLDYLQKELSRRCKIIGDRGMVIWDYTRNKVSWSILASGENYTFAYPGFERNDRFKTCMRKFLEGSFRDPADDLVDVRSALESLRLVELSKKSNESKKVENL